MSIIPIVSSRKNFYKAGVISKQDKIRLVNLSDPRPTNNLSISSDMLMNRVKGKHVVILVHGYNNNFHEVCDAYLRIHNQFIDHNIPHDEVIGYIWPGGNKALSYWGARKRARQLSGRISGLLNALSDKVESIDMVAHSMGCFLSLATLKKSKKQRIRNIYLMAPAVENHKLSNGNNFYNVVKHTNGTYVFKSTNDLVLKHAFYYGSGCSRALGYTGPIPQVANKVVTINCSNQQDPIGHGSYKQRTEIYQFIANNQSSVASASEVALV